mmetsp:Transcript_95155/g.254341  ORF Transcript_95155/g.254341 Transcript_95155/m.254341 type:complete len:250 (+) Transcript_95155:1410-2159(+)
MLRTDPEVKSTRRILELPVSAKYKRPALSMLIPLGLLIIVPMFVAISSYPGDPVPTTVFTVPGGARYCTRKSLPRGRDDVVRARGTTGLIRILPILSTCGEPGNMSCTFSFTFCSRERCSCMASSSMAPRIDAESPAYMWFWAYRRSARASDTWSHSDKEDACNEYRIDTDLCASSSESTMLLMYAIRSSQNGQSPKWAKVPAAVEAVHLCAIPSNCTVGFSSGPLRISVRNVVRFEHSGELLTQSPRN